jgi:hypothetical protein
MALMPAAKAKAGAHIKGGSDGPAGASPPDVHRPKDDQVQLSDWVRLDTCVSVVSVADFWDNLHSIEELRDRCVACIKLLCSAH